MSYLFGEEQEMIRHLSNDFFKREWSISLARDVWDKKRDFSLELYQGMAKLGYLGLLVPEKYGGMDRSWMNAAIFYEEAGRVLFPVAPHYYSAIVGAQIILAFGTEDQKRDLLPKLVRGNAIFTMGWLEPQMAHDTFDMGSTATRAVRDKGGFVITGCKLPVRNLALAHYIITPAKVDGGSDVALFLVDGKSNGVVAKPMYDMGGETVHEVTYEGVKVAVDKMLGKPIAGRQVTDILEKSKVVRCAEMAGGAQRALELAVDHAKQRVQFDRPIGTFQALQHKAADMQIAVHVARLFAYESACQCGQEAYALASIAMAVQVASNAYIAATNESVHIHGGYGLMHQTDISLYFRRAKSIQLEMGAPYAYKDRIADYIGL